MDGSCAFKRGPSPCRYSNAKVLRDLQNQCSAGGATFDSWARKYQTSGDLYNKFEACSGLTIEKQAKMVIKFCYCYNFCGAGQTRNGCEVEGLEGRLNRAANLFSSYKAVYVKVSYCLLTMRPKFIDQLSFSLFWLILFSTLWNKK